MAAGLRRFYGRHNLHFITCSCYRRISGLSDPEHRNILVRQLEKVRTRYGFALIGYVVMPEHIHLLMSEPRLGDPSIVMQVLKQTVSWQILKKLRSARAGSSHCRLLERLRVSPLTAGARFWQRRFYDFNVWSEKKIWQKLEYMHLNPVKRGLVKHPGHWPWSSFRFYAFGDAKMLGMDRLS
jgi:putative transposase